MSIDKFGNVDATIQDICQKFMFDHKWVLKTESNPTPSLATEWCKYSESIFSSGKQKALTIFPYKIFGQS